MLFNSFEFLGVFLPITFLGFFLLARYSEKASAGWLAAASIVFYGWWSVAYIPLLLASVVLNYFAGMRIGHGPAEQKRAWLWAAVIANLGLLAYFKYADFLVGSVNAVAHTDFLLLNVVLPIGISFFTFTQIAFLVDTYQGKVREYRFVHYLLFVTYFPHLIAGPVLHHKEMMPQFADPKTYRLSYANIAVGSSIFIFGLAKKVLIADNLAPQAAYLFDSQEAPSLLIAWGGVLSYTFQLYFDFSGYSDMAIGLSRLFGVTLPLNFNSPYKAQSISDFWRRWHMTLSRFLRDYLYISLGGNRRGPIRRYLNLWITMLLGGLWHGAGWNFVIWGGLHGAYLMVNHGWSTLTSGKNWSQSLGVRWLGSLVTFAAICFAWVFFRATNVDTARAIVNGMVGAYGLALPDSILSHLGPLQTILSRLGVNGYLGGGSRFIETYSWIGVAGVLVFFFPNTQEIMERYAPALDHVVRDSSQLQRRILDWNPGWKWATVLGGLAVACLLSLSRPAEFLYFQF